MKKSYGKNAGLEKTEFGKGHSFQTKNMNFKNLTMTKIVKRGPLGFLKIKFDAKYKKNEEGDIN